MGRANTSPTNASSATQQSIAVGNSDLASPTIPGDSPNAYGTGVGTRRLARAYAIVALYVRILPVGTTVCTYADAQTNGEPVAAGSAWTDTLTACPIFIFTQGSGVAVGAITTVIAV